MPPKVRITKDMIIDAAYELVRSQGVERLNARELAKCAGCSTQPIFSACSNMEVVTAAVVVKAKDRMKQYRERFKGEDNPLLGIGMAYILFAGEESNLFELLYRVEPANDIFEELTGSAVMKAVAADSGLDGSYVASLCRNYFCYIHGIAVCNANPDGPKVIPDEGELKAALKDFYKGYRKLYKKKADNG